MRAHVGITNGHRLATAPFAAWRSTRAAAAAALLALAAAPAAHLAAAQLPVGIGSSGPSVTKEQSHDRDQPIQDHNPCTMEDISGLGHLHTKIRSQTTPTMTKFSFSTHQNGTATGVQSLARYEYQHWSDNEWESSEPTFTSRLVNRKHIIRTGPAAPVKDDFFFRETMTVTSNGVDVTENVESFQPEQSCK
jgi:hypothetical protein